LLAKKRLSESDIELGQIKFKLSPTSSDLEVYPSEHDTVSIPMAIKPNPQSPDYQNLNTIGAVFVDQVLQSYSLVVMAGIYKTLTSLNEQLLKIANDEFAEAKKSRG
jgi:hypothetical protein